MKISLIAALATNRAIGIQGKIPWHLSADLKYFQKLTNHKAIIMGRKTYESLPGILPNRFHIVLTRNATFLQEKENVQVCHTFQEALFHAEKVSPDESFIIGGSQIYEFALKQKLPTHLYLTKVFLKPKADTYFPEFSGYSLQEKKGPFTEKKSSISYEYQIFARSK